MTGPERVVLDLLSDPRVRAMADRNHHPEEIWTFGGWSAVNCRTCGQRWPCATREALDTADG